ncbi:hypothetical protein K0J45_06185 [Shewanella alkalitolerans]|uniref:hypothetical protein n=1 Tax=Shewanella alkalitolerans TaxID=2864209 RepID=UPI001C656753|nr:hypothetical protein [Shewanella alkalitolerans]QYJ98816.1 hypothetical protein K0J45_06185 [Shewanella alkalitolerans]
MSDENDKMLSDAELKALYLAKATEQPSTELDARILAMAQQRLTEKAGEIGQSGSANVIQVSFWRRYRWPLSSAASVLLLSSLLLLNLNGPTPINDQVRPMLASEPQAMRMAAPPEPQEQQEPDVQQGPSAQADVADAELASPQAVTMMARKAPVDLKTESQSDGQGELESLTAQQVGAVDLNTATDAKAATQAKAVISDIQAVNHLQQLVDSKLWSDADTLYQRLLKERPRLEDNSHPQHAQWQALVKQIKAHSQSKE